MWRVAVAFMLLSVAACGSVDAPPSGPVSKGPPGITITEGATATDTIATPVATPLTAAVRLPDGTPAVGAVVRFEALPSADPTNGNPTVWICPVSRPECFARPRGSRTDESQLDTVDASGLARMRVRLGWTAGRGVVRIYVPELGLEDSASYTVRPGNIVGVKAAVSDVAMNIGGSLALPGYVVDRFGNRRSEPVIWSSTPGTAIQLNGATGVASGTDMGEQRVFLRFLIWSDSILVRVVPAGRLVVRSSSFDSILLVDTDGSHLRTVIEGVNSGLGVYPRFDTNRERVTLMQSAGISPREVPLMNVVESDTFGVARRGINASGTLSSVIVTRRVADGTTLAIGARLDNAVLSPLSLLRIAADGTVQELAALADANPCAGCADISPDGSRVAYLTGQPDGGLRGLRVLNVATGQLTSVANDANAPRWSPRGDRLAWISTTQQAQDGGPFDGVLVISKADGTGRQSFGEAGRLSPGMSWSPDERYVVARRFFGRWVVIRLADGATVDLPRSLGGYVQPDWR